MTQPPLSTDMTPDDEVMVNAALVEASTPPARDTLKRDILAAYDDEQRKPHQAGNHFADISILFKRFRLATAGALASISMLGVAVGALTANTAMTLTPEDELYIYAEDAFSLALIEDEEWDQ